MSQLPQIQGRITSCERCPRLRKHCQKIAREKKRAFADQTYWGKPIPGFGAPDAPLVLIGLAPAAHGANRTGRIFTGDRSGDWLYRALYRAGFANQPTSVSKDDGLKLLDAYITCVVKCAPPDNKPSPTEEKNCSIFLKQELEVFGKARVFVTFGQIALRGAWPFLNSGNPRPRFSHGGKAQLPGGRTLLMSYHPSQQNTFTGRLTEPMFDAIFTEARNLLQGADRF